jgi:hypothetical protein
MIFIKYFKLSILFIVLEITTFYGLSQGVYTSMTRNLPVNIISGTGTNITFDNNIPIGFTFSFYGGDFTTLKLNAKGYLYFNNQQDNSTSSLPTGSSKIIAFAKSSGDLYPQPSTIINYFTTGTAPNRILVINFRNYSNVLSQNVIDIQVQLYEGTNKIEIHNVTNSSVSRWQVLGIQGNSYYLTDARLNGNYFSGANAISNEMIRFIPCNGPLTRIPTISASSDSICNGQDVTLSATGCLPSDTVRWSNGKTGKTIIERLTSAIPYTYTAKCVESVTLCESSSNSNTKQITVGYLSGGVIPKPMIVGYKPTMSSVVGKIWDKRYGSNYVDGLNASLKTKDGGYLLGGTSSSDIGYEKSQDAIGQGDYWVVKIDSIGNKLWDKRFGGYDIDIITSMIEVEGGSFLLAGHSKSPISSQGGKTAPHLGFHDYFIIKIDGNGNRIWDKSFGGNGDDVLSSIISINNGKDFILAGSTTTSNNLDVTQPTFGNNDFWIIKIDSSGNKKWNKRFGGSGDDYLKKIITTNDNNFLLVGSSYSPISGNKSTLNKGLNDFWVIKIDTSGNKIWDKTFGGSTTDILVDVVKNNDGSFVLAGTTNSTDGDVTEPKKVFAATSKDYWILKIDALGNKIWDKRFSSGEGSSDDYLRVISNISGIGYVIAGVSNGEKGADKSGDGIISHSDDFWVLGLDESGTKVWDRSFGGEGEEILSNIIFSKDGSFLMTGSTNAKICQDITEICRGQYDFWVEKSSGYFLEKSVKLGDSLKLEVLGCPGSNILWSDGNTNAIRVVSPNTTTNYTVTCKLSPCASVGSKTFILNVLIVPPPSLSSNKSNICFGSSATLTATGCAGTVSWNTTPVKTGTTILVTPTNTTSYTATCNVEGSSSENSLPIIVSVNPLTISSIISGMWNVPSTWSCNCVPTECSNVIVETSHIVTIPNNIIGNIKNLKVNGQIDLKNTSGVFSH